MITFDELKNTFCGLEQLGFQVPAKHDGLVYSGPYHRVRVTTLDRASTVSVDVVLSELANSYVDAYSIIGFCYVDKLVDFLNQRISLADRNIAEFIAARLSGDCAKIFKRIGTSEWMELHQYHRLSLQRRNKAFWAKVSGTSALYPEAEIAEPPTF